MKIACIGNMNNMMFCLTRYLRDRGYDASLLTLNSEPSHFSPEADSYNDLYKTYTRELSWSKFPSTLYDKTKREILDEVRNFDFFIAADVAPAYLAKAGIRTDIFIPYGSDIHTIPHLNILDAPIRKIHKYHQLKKYQRLAIKNARYISLETTNPQFKDQFVDSLEIGGILLDVTCPFIYYPQYENGEMEEYKLKSKIYPEFLKIREKSDLMVFQHSRQEWNEDGSMEVSKYIWSKGNDKLIRGFKMFVDSHATLKSSLILFEYGTQVDLSKKLVKDLDLENKVFWFPISSRKDIMTGISLADMGIGELAMSWFTYGAILEFMALGIPFAHNRQDDLYSAKNGNLYPMLYAKNEFEIEATFNQWLNNKELVVQMGNKAKLWFKENVVESTLKLYSTIIDN
jgi:hypothetical protein